MVSISLSTSFKVALVKPGHAGPMVLYKGITDHLNRTLFNATSSMWNALVVALDNDTEMGGLIRDLECGQSNGETVVRFVVRSSLCDEFRR